MSSEEFDKTEANKILQLAANTTAGGVALLLAVREIVQILHGSQTLQGIIDDRDFRFLVGVSSECDELPLGAERQYWAPESLREKDLRSQKYENLIGNEVRSTLMRIAANLQPMSNSNA
jgi:hypothetical protein